MKRVLCISHQHQNICTNKCESRPNSSRVLVNETFCSAIKIEKTNEFTTRLHCSPTTKFRTTVECMYQSEIFKEWFSIKIAYAVFTPLIIRYNQAQTPPKYKLFTFGLRLIFTTFTATTTKKGNIAQCWMFVDILNIIKINSRVTVNLKTRNSIVYFKSVKEVCCWCTLYLKKHDKWFMGKHIRCEAKKK